MPSPTGAPRSSGGPSGDSSARQPDRLRKRADFAAVMRTGRRARHPLLHLVARRTESDTTRIGYSVSKQVGGAVVRNRVKRRLRAIVRGRDWKSGFDLVLVARPRSDVATYGELEGIVCENARKLGLLGGEDR